MGRNRFATFAWIVLLYNVAVIIFGAFVRASLSGDGCGSHWPGCGGEIIPSIWDAKKTIEFTHRVMSGLDGLLVLALVVWAFRNWRMSIVDRRSGETGDQRSNLNHPVTASVFWASAVAMLFVVFEALIGRGLVLSGWVANDKSVGRAILQSLHLANTFLLLGALALVWVWGRGAKLPNWKGQSGIVWALGIGFVGMLLLGVSGAVTALGDNLFPVSSSSQAVIDSLDPTKHFLVRLRILHPLIAGSVGLYLLLISGVLSNLRPSERVKKLAGWVSAILITQIGLGLVNVWLKAPIPMQLMHLILADAMWITLVILAVEAIAEGVPRAEPAIAPAPPTERLRGKPLVKAYLLLTKPRVISLLLFTTLTAMFMAAGGWPGFWLFLAVAVAGYMSAGAANTINMVLERDLDQSMARTANRPTVTQSISGNAALRFGFALAIGAFALLWAAANILTAMLALAGLVFYVVVYTLLLKRRTWHNIVIGGAAGAFPPLVGWASVTGDLGPLAWTLFGIIFVWTPVHFWALALLIKDDYAKAGVPMLPVVKGERATVLQIGLYAILTAIVTALPLVQKEAGAVYLWTAVALNLLLLVRCYQLMRSPDRTHAVTLYKYSMVYLAVLFLLLAVDRAGNPASPHEEALRERGVVGYGRIGVVGHATQKAARKTVKGTTMEGSRTGARLPARHGRKEGGRGSDIQA